MRLEGPKQDRIREIVITGDFFVTPPATIYNLEAALRGVEVRSLDKAVTEFFQNARTGLLTATPADFVTAINVALSVDA